IIVKEYSRLGVLYKKLKDNKIEASELDELLSLLERKDIRHQVEPELKKSCQEHNHALFEPHFSEQILELKKKAQAMEGGQSGGGRKFHWKRRTVVRAASIAASLIAAVAFLIALNVFDSRIEYQTGYGERQKINLPDGSVV